MKKRIEVDLLLLWLVGGSIMYIIKIWIVKLQNIYIYNGKLTGFMYTIDVASALGCVGELSEVVENINDDVNS